MQLTELKLITASNLIKLRTAAGMTQAELGARLNYSDKTISKWERGDGLPDAFVITQLAEIFGVTTDYLLSSHDGWEPPEPETEEGDRPSYSANMLIALVMVTVCTTALTIFVVLWLFDIMLWDVFVIALPIALLTYLVLVCIFKKRRQIQYAIAAFVFSLFVLLYFELPKTNPWQLFLLALPVELIVFLACNIRRKPRSHRD